MKTTISILLSALFALTLIAQDTVRVPVVSYVDIPISTNGSTVINITTNVYNITTNILVTQIVTNVPSTSFTLLKNDIVDPALGNRLMRFMNGPSFFVFTNFGTDRYTQLSWNNPGRFPVNFQTNNVFWLGNAPTNQSRGVVLLEMVGGEYWLTP